MTALCFSFHSRNTLTFFFFFFNDTATTEIYTLSLHDALPISLGGIAEDALDPHRVPLRAAERAGQIAQAVVRADAHDAHHGRGTTRWAEMRDVEPAEGTGPERRDQMQPVRLQRRADEWYLRPIELFIIIAGEQRLG